MSAEHPTWDDIDRVIEGGSLTESGRGSNGAEAAVADEPWRVQAMALGRRPRRDRPLLEQLEAVGLPRGYAAGVLSWLDDGMSIEEALTLAGGASGATTCGDPGVVREAAVRVLVKAGCQQPGMGLDKHPQASEEDAVSALFNSEAVAAERRAIAARVRSMTSSPSTGAQVTSEGYAKGAAMAACESGARQGSTAEQVAASLRETHTFQALSRLFSSARVSPSGRTTAITEGGR